MVDLVNTEERLVRWFHERWGGSLRCVDPSGKRKRYWRLRIASREAASFLRSIAPYLVGEKATRVALGLAFQAQKRGGGASRTAEYVARQRWFYERMKKLNRRGRPPEKAKP